MLSQREIRYHKRKIIGGSLLKNVYDKVRKVVSTGSKILSRTGDIAKKTKKLVANVSQQIEKIPAITKQLPVITQHLNDRSRAILSNLIAGSGFKNYIS